MNHIAVRQLADAVPRWRAAAGYLLTTHVDPDTLARRYAARRVEWRAPRALTVARVGVPNVTVGLLGLAAAVPACIKAGAGLDKPAVLNDGQPEEIARLWRLRHGPSGRHDLPALSLILDVDLDLVAALVQVGGSPEDTEKRLRGLCG